MDGDSPTALHKRLVELLRVAGHNPLRVSQIAAILGIDKDDDAQNQLLRDQLSRSRIIEYDAAEQTVRSVLPEHGATVVEDEDEAALLALSDVDVAGYSQQQQQRPPPPSSSSFPHRHGHRSSSGGAAGAASGGSRLHQRRSTSRHATGGGGYRSDTGLPPGRSESAHNATNRSFTGLSRRRLPGGWGKVGQRTLDDAASNLGPVGRVGYVCVADELHLGKLEAYYRAQGYYTKFDFDVLHVRFAQPASAGGIHVDANANASSSTIAPAAASSSSGAGYAHPNASYGLHQRQREESASNDTSPSPPPQGVRTAADTSPSHRNYGSTKTAKASGSGSGEGGEAAGTTTTTSTTAAAFAAASASVKHGFDLFIFPYGAVVWWGFDQRYFKIVENDYMLPNSGISHCMTNRYTTQLVNENYPVWCTYNLVRRDTLEVDDDFKARLRFDHFVIPYSRGEVATGSVLMLCAAHALAQSAKIDYIELQVQELADSCSPLPRELREKGTVSITERRLLQLRGEVLSYRLMLKSGSDLLDEPDFFWENAYLKPVFQATKEEFEIADRVEALDNKLDAANEILSMLAEDFSQRHGARLEWIVIWLVFVEVVIGVLELLVDIRPWMRSK